VHPCSLPPRRRAAAAAALCLLAAAGAAVAQDEDQPLPPGGRPLWDLGAVGVGGEQQADTRLSRGAAAPYGVYRGKVVQAGEGGLRVRAMKTPTTEVDVGFSGSFGSNSDEVPARAGMRNLGSLIEFGPRLKFNLPPLLPGTRITATLPLRGVFDLSNSLYHRGMAFEPALNLGWRPWANTGLGVGLGIIYGDRRLASHFYGVPDEFVNEGIGRTAFEARSGLIATRLSLSATMLLHRDVRFGSYLRYQSVSGAANEDSPLVRQTTGYTAGIGLTWTFYRSERTAED
jgi:outer membrane protein